MQKYIYKELDGNLVDIIFFCQGLRQDQIQSVLYDYVVAKVPGSLPGYYYVKYKYRKTYTKDNRDAILVPRTIERVEGRLSRLYDKLAKEKLAEDK